MTKTKISNSTELQNRISELERKIKGDEADIKMNFAEVKDNLQPKKVVKNTFGFLAETPEIQRTLVNTAFGFVLGFASKEAVSLLSEQSLNRSIENLVTHQLTKLENKEPGSLVSRGISLFRKFTPPTSPIYPFVRYK